MELAIDELKRLFAPFASPEEGNEAMRYWAFCSAAERMASAACMRREVYRSMGHDVDQPMVKTSSRVTFEDEALESAKFHPAAQQLLADR
jgi:hypothetical protein